MVVPQGMSYASTAGAFRGGATLCAGKGGGVTHQGCDRGANHAHNHTRPACSSPLHDAGGGPVPLMQDAQPHTLPAQACPPSTASTVPSCPAWCTRSSAAASSSPSGASPRTVPLHLSSRTKRCGRLVLTRLLSCSSFLQARGRDVAAHLHAPGEGHHLPPGACRAASGAGDAGGAAPCSAQRPASLLPDTVPTRAPTPAEHHQLQQRHQRLHHARGPAVHAKVLHGRHPNRLPRRM